MWDIKKFILICCIQHIFFSSNWGDVDIKIILLMFLAIMITFSDVSVWPLYNWQTKAIGFLGERTIQTY